MKRIVFREQVAAKRSVQERRIYPWSVIGGGAYSAEELSRARRIDPVVRAHYAGFGRNPVVQPASRDLLVYVSYRKSDAVYWTRTKRRVPKGELVLSDHENLARARCGNRLSFTPQQPTSPDLEPTEEAFNTPEAPKVLIPSDAPTLPVTEADSYVPADLLSSLPSPAPFAAPHSAETPGAGGAYAPISGWGLGSPVGGTPFPAKANGLAAPAGAGSGASSAGSIFTKNFAAASVPEPGSAKLLLLPVLILIFFGLRGRIHWLR